MVKEILILNSGSSSLKFSLFRDGISILQGEVENIKKRDSFFWTKGVFNREKNLSIPDYKSAVNQVTKVVQSCTSKLSGIGHRVVFGGDEFADPIIVNAKILKKLKSLAAFAPLHMPQEIMIIERMQEAFPKTMQVACFDTCFHQTLPQKSKTLGLPKYFSKVRRFGFHGLSFESIVAQFDTLPKRMIVAHLGNGVSLCAIKRGKSIDTTMGLTPLGGVLMGTRPGDLDPGAILYLLKEKKLSLEKLEELLYHESGLKGISGISSDMKVLLKEPLAKRAIELFCYRIAKMIGSYFIALEGLDALVFTGGIGQKSAVIRRKICSQLYPLGIFLDEKANKKQDYTISKKNSSKVFIIPTEEEKIMERHVAKFC